MPQIPPDESSNLEEGHQEKIIFNSIVIAPRNNDLTFLDPHPLHCREAGIKIIPFSNPRAWTC